MNTSFGTKAFAALVAMSHAHYIVTRIDKGLPAHLYERGMRNAMRTASRPTDREAG